MGEMFGMLLGIPEGHIANIGEGYAIIVVGVFSLAGWYLARRASKAEHRRSNAHRYIMNKDEQVKARLDPIRHYLITEKLAPNYEETAQSLDYEKLVIPALSEMETCAIDIAYGYASEGYIVVTQRNLLKNIYQVFRAFIGTMRTKRDKPTIFREFETLYIRIAYPQALGILWVLEAIYGQPLFSLTRWIWSQKYSILHSFYGLPARHIDADPNEVRKALKDFHAYVIYPGLFLIVFFVLLFSFHAGMRLSS